MEIKEGEVAQAKVIENIFNKRIGENTLNPGKEIFMQVEETFIMQNE